MCGQPKEEFINLGRTKNFNTTTYIYILTT